MDGRSANHCLHLDKLTIGRTDDLLERSVLVCATVIVRVCFCCSTGRVEDITVVKGTSVEYPTGRYGTATVRVTELCDSSIYMERIYVDVTTCTLSNDATCARRSVKPCT